VVFVVWDAVLEVALLEGIGVDVDKFLVLDAQKLDMIIRKTSIPRRLSAVAEEFGLPPAPPHCAGNDAHHTVLCASRFLMRRSLKGGCF